ncbi:MAG: tyrosine-type recombinase/integrase [Actinomycetota bacterium]|nr:tyrosine-type recombinase/integrase [Actinomycetota bacterium]
MASVTKRQKDGPEGRKRDTWVVRWRDADGAQKKKSFAKKSDADRFKSAIENSLHQGTYVDPNKGKQTFAEYAQKWLKAKNITSVNRAKSVAMHLRLTSAALGRRPIASITPSDIEALVNELSNGRSARSVQTIMSTPRMIFAMAVRDRVIAFNPIFADSLPKAPRPRALPMTELQVQMIMDELPPRYRAMVLTSALSGLRKGEVFGLRVTDVKWRGNHEIHVARQIQPVRVGDEIKRGPVLPKKHKTRIVPVGAEVIDVLTEHLRQFPANEDGYIFTNTLGRPLHDRVFDNIYRRARLKAADRLEQQADAADEAATRAELLALAEQLRDARSRFHQLRHYYASALINSGHSPKSVQELLGHSSASTTLDIYTHLWHNDGDRARETSDRIAGALKITAPAPQMRPSQ